MYYKPDWEQVKKRMEALWAGELVDRCCVSVAAPKDGKGDVSPFAKGPCNRDDPADVADFWTNGERILQNNLCRLENAWLGGEALPVIVPNFGTSGHAVYYGAKYTFSPETVWFDPVVQDLEEADLRYNPENEFYKKQRQIVRYLVQESKGRYMVALPDNCGTLDALGHLHGSQQVLMDLLLCPQAVKEAIHTINQGWKDSIETFYQLTSPSCEGGSCVGWMDLWAPGRTAQMQCDMSVMFSPQMYGEFEVPELEEQMEWIEYPVYHFDGKEQIAHLDHLLGLSKLRVIQWTNVAGQESPAHYVQVLKKMQQAGKVINVFTPPRDIPALMEELSSKGLYLHTYASSPDEGEEIVTSVARHTRG